MLSCYIIQPRMTEEILEEIIAAYGLEVEHRLPMQSGYRNKNFPLVLKDGQVVNLVLHKREPNMRQTVDNANYICGVLYAKRFPVRHRFDKRIISLYSKPPEQLVGLYTYLPGVTIPWEAYTMGKIKSLGKTMSDMHALLADEPQKSLHTIDEIYNPLLDRMIEYFENPLVAQAVREKLHVTIKASFFTDIRQLINASKHLPDQQPLHLDFVRGNVLFANNGSKITGVLDFEKTAYGHAAFDIARTLAFLFVDCKYKTEDKVRKYFLTSGYSKRGQSSSSQITIRTTNSSFDLLERAIDFYLFYDFYRFLLHNPYESLNKNEHFHRTLSLLISRGVIMAKH